MRLKVSWKFAASFSGTTVGPYDIMPDGQRFLAAAPVADAASPTMTVILNWQAELLRQEVMAMRRSEGLLLVSCTDRPSWICPTPSNRHAKH